METTPKKRLFSRKEYYQMAETGILACTDRTELIDGEIIIKSPSGPYHSSRVSRLISIFTPLIQDKAQINTQNPIRLSNFSEPEPDFFLVKPRKDHYAKEHPTVLDILLLIEFSHSTYSFDRNVKIPLYAKSGIPEAWILNLNEDRVEVFKHPAEGVYQKENILQPGEEIFVEVLNSRIAVGELVGS